MSTELVQKLKARLVDPEGLMDLDDVIAEARETGKRITGFAGVDCAGDRRAMRVDVSKMYAMTVGEMDDLTTFIAKQNLSDQHPRTKLAKLKRKQLAHYIKRKDTKRGICITYEEAMLLLGETNEAAEVVDLARKKKSSKKVVG